MCSFKKIKYLKCIPFNYVPEKFRKFEKNLPFEKKNKKPKKKPSSFLFVCFEKKSKLFYVVAFCFFLHFKKVRELNENQIKFISYIHPKIEI